MWKTLGCFFFSLECVVSSFSRGSCQPRDQTWVSHIAGRCFTIWATREVITYVSIFHVCLHCHRSSPPRATLFCCCCFLLFFFFFFNFWLHWVFIAGLRLSLVAASGDYPSLQCASFSLRWLLSCDAWVLGHSSSVVVAHGLSWSIACEIFPDQGLSLYPLHW